MSEEETNKPSAAYERDYKKNLQSEVELKPEETRTVKYGINPTLMSFMVGVLFGVVIPLFLRAVFGNLIEIVSPSASLPVYGESDEEYNGVVDLASPKGFVDQVVEKLTTSLTVLWVAALIYLFPIIYQLRIAIIYGKITQTLCLALTLMGPFAVIVLTPLWSSVLTG